MQTIKECSKLINKFVVALGGFNDKAVEANDIYFCFVRPVSRAFGEEEDSEPVEESVEESIFAIRVATWFSRMIIR